MVAQALTQSLKDVPAGLGVGEGDDTHPPGLLRLLCLGGERPGPQDRDEESEHERDEQRDQEQL